MAATAGDEIRTRDRMGTKLKEEHHVHWTLMRDKPHTPESTILSTRKQQYGHARTHMYTQKARDKNRASERA